MIDSKKLENIKILTFRPEGQKGEYSTYVEISSNPREVSLKFCDLKPPTPEKLKKIKEDGSVTIPVNTEIALPFDVAEALLGALKTQIETIKEKFEKEEKK